jgi:hypothetical protein
MILKSNELAAIRAGSQTLVFRRWVRPSVKSGGTLRTRIGVLGIERVEIVDRLQLTAKDAEQAGHASLAALNAYLDQRDGDIYRVAVRFVGEDPRVSLRENDSIEATELEGLLKKLDRLDGASKVGPWTLAVLTCIGAHPHVVSTRLAAKTGFEKEWLKINIRKLKNLGLTTSHEVGYELSPRGRVVLRALAAKKA